MNGQEMNIYWPLHNNMIKFNGNLKMMRPNLINDLKKSFCSSTTLKHLHYKNNMYRYFDLNIGAVHA